MSQLAGLALQANQLGFEVLAQIGVEYAEGVPDTSPGLIRDFATRLELW